MADDHTAGRVDKVGSRRAEKTWQEAVAARRPEEWLINDYALFQAVVGKFVTGLAFLALTWSTVVLLGGYIGALRIKDFWALTVISFVLASTVLTVYDLDTEFSRAVINTGIGFHKAFNRSSLWFYVAGGIQVVVLQLLQLLIWGAIILYGLGPIFCIGFSAQRVWEHDYGDADGVAANKAKLRSALLIFYSLVLLQTICFSTWMILQANLRIQVCRISSQCGFGKWGGEVVSGYLRETKVKCANDLRLPGDWNLIIYAVGLLESASPDDQLAAARVLDTLRGEEVSVRLELQSSRRSIKNLIGMLGWRSPDDREIRERAARIIADVSGELHITQFPGALQCISSLLDASQQVHDQETLALSLEGSSESSETSGQNGHNQRVLILPSGSSHRRTTGDKMNKTQKIDKWYFTSTELQMTQVLELEVDDSFVPNGPKELIFQGVLILERLTQDQENCSEICRNQGLVSQITGPITSNTFLDTDYDDTWVDILSTSLAMVSRLVSTSGEACQSLRDKFGRSKEAADNMLGILESGNNGYLRLQEQAIEILAEVALDMPTTTTKSFIRKLRCIFLDDANNSSNVVEEDKQRTSRMRKKAGEALAKLLCVQDASNSKAIMEMFWENGNVVDQLTDILVKNKLCQISAAEILEHLCSHFTKYRELPKQDVISLLTKVLKQVQSIRTNVDAYADAGRGASNNSAVKTDVESQPPRDANRRKLLAAQLSEERELPAALLSEERKLLAALPSEERKLLAALLSEERKLLAALLSEERKLLAALPSEQRELLAALRSEERKLPAALRSEERKLLAALPSEKRKLLAALRSVERKLLATLPSEERELLAALPSEERKLLAALRSEETKLLAALLSEERKLLAALLSEERKLLAALLSLTTVICDKLIDADDFSRVAPETDALVRALKEMIDNNNDTTADCLRFLKLTTQVVITMIRHKPSYIKDFEEHNFKESLSKALKRVSDLDNCMLFSRNNRIVARRFRSVSSLVKEAQKLLETKESSESVSNSSV